MPVTIKTPEQIEKMRQAGRLAASVLEMIAPMVKAGVSTETLNQRCHDYIIEHGAVPAPLNYHGFPKSICTSINHQVCHGIPSEDKILKDGDIINIDITVIKDGFHGDTSQMFTIGKPSILAQRLIDTTREALLAGIRCVKPGAYLGDIGHVIETMAHRARFSVVHEYCGHGIGEGFHEEPQVLHYGRPQTGLQLKAGMTFTIEPMLNAGKRHVKCLSDNWTVVTKDRSLSAQWEHTILVTETGYEVLTRRHGEDDI